MSTILQFHKHSDDWCHFCGRRIEKLIDVFYPANAEHPRGKEMEYVRICYLCVDTMARIVEEPMDIKDSCTMRTHHLGMMGINADNAERFKDC